MSNILNNIFNSPIKGLSSLTITSSFGNRTFFNVKTGKRESGFHSGIDLIGGNTIISTAAGKVSSIRTNIKGYNENYASGNYITIYHGNNVYTKYCHIKYGSIKVKKGDIVKIGSILGITGATGHATGVHLHYGVKVNNKWVNPIDYLLGNKVLPNLYTNEEKNEISQTFSYKIKKGDTLSSIALTFHTTVAKLVELNKIKNPNLIIANETLINKIFDEVKNSI